MGNTDQNDQKAENQDAPKEDTRIPTGYTPNYGFRDFDQAKVHRNGTFFDDDGYDIYFLDCDGHLRPDKTPPFQGTYMLGIISAVSTALDIAADLIDIEPYKEEDPWITDPIELGVMTEGELVWMTNWCGYYDYKICDYDLSDVPAGTWTYDVTHGKFLVVDPTGNPGLGGDLPHTVWEFTFWDEETGDILLDQSDFLAALAQIGNCILHDIEEPDYKPGRSIYDDRLRCAAKLLEVPVLWSGTSPMRWAERGAALSCAGDLASWDDATHELVKAARSAKKAEQERLHSTAPDYDPEEDYNNDIPF